MRLPRVRAWMALVAVPTLCIAAAGTVAWAGPRLDADSSASPAAAPGARIRATPVGRPAFSCATGTPTTVAGFSRMLGAPSLGVGDLSISVALPGGRTVWLYGDTVTGKDSRNFTRMVHSSAVVEVGGCLHSSNGGAQLLPDDGPQRISWITSALALDASHLLLATSQQQLLGTCALCFVTTGTRGAVVQVTPAGDLKFTSWVGGWPKVGTSVQWGTALVRADNGTVELYGISPAGLARSLYVASAPSVAAALHGGWRASLAPIAAGIHPSGASVFHDGAGWHVVTQRGAEVVELSSDRPSGPFVEQNIAVLPAAGPGQVFYAVAAHPSFALNSSGLLLSYCTTWLDGSTHPLASYRPRYVEGRAVQPASDAT